IYHDLHRMQMNSKANNIPSPAKWSLDSWRELPIKQQPEYLDSTIVQEVEAKLKALPPLASPGESRALKRELADAAHGKAFLLQGGDCAESFAEFSEENLRSFFR